MSDLDKYFEEHIQTKRIDKETWAVIEYCKQHYRLNSANQDMLGTSSNGNLSNDGLRDTALCVEIREVFKRENIQLDDIHELFSCKALFDSDTTTFTKEFLDKYLEYICTKVCWDVDCYKFIYYISSFITRYYTSIHKSYLEDLCYNHSEDYKTKRLMIGFAAYYCLYTYIRKSEIGDWTKIQLMERFVTPSYFNHIYSTYALSKEIEATYHRLIGGIDGNFREINKSIEISRELLEEGYMKNNAAVIATYCDCIIWELKQKIMIDGDFEKTKEFVENYNRALSYIEHATELVPDYPTYFRIYGQLLQYKQNIYPEMDANEKLNDLKESKKQFEKARLLVDRNGFDSVKRINDIYLLEIQSSIMMTEITASETAEISGNDIAQRLEQKIYLRMIELLGLFTAIIALVITTVQNITSVQSDFASLNTEAAQNILPILYENSVNLTVLFGLVILILFGMLLVGVRVISGKLSKEKRCEKWGTLIIVGIVIIAILLLIIVDVIFKNNFLMF